MTTTSIDIDRPADVLFAASTAPLAIEFGLPHGFG